MKQHPSSTTALRVSELSQNAPTAFLCRPDATHLKEIAEDLDLSSLRKLSFSGEIAAQGKADWRLTGKLGATVVQPCAVTLEPVTTRIDVPVQRLYQKDYVDIDAPEAEMPEDDTVEPLTAWIDPGAVMLEALALHVPEYPRADGAELGELVVTEPGVAPMRDEDARPFAGLAALKDQLSAQEQTEDSATDDSNGDDK